MQENLSYPSSSKSGLLDLRVEARKAFWARVPNFEMFASGATAARLCQTLEPESRA